MVLLSSGILLVSFFEMGFLLILIGLIGFSFFGLCEIAIIKQLFKEKELVILNDQGFYSNRRSHIALAYLSPAEFQQKILAV